MNANPETERKRLSQATFLEQIRRNYSPTDFIQVFSSIDRSHGKEDSSSALIPNHMVDEVLSKPEWELSMGDGMPGTAKYSGENDESIVEYFRFGDDSGIEPFIFWRSFHDMRPTYIEINEEFRLFHNLYHDRKTEKYIRFEDDGSEVEVAVVVPNQVRIRLREIQQFLAAKEMHLAIYFDNSERSTLHLTQLGIDEGGPDVRNGLLTYALTFGDFGGAFEVRALSRLLGKRLIPPVPKEQSGLWGFSEEEPEQCVDFIIGVESSGKPVLHTSEEGALSNYFGANPGAPHYLTPVTFKKAVLDKYYQQPTKYSVSDSHLACGSLWGMQMDNHNDEYVVAWLGDLRRDLPYIEQLHWRSHNVLPCGPPSKVFISRQLLCQPVDTDQPDLKFKQDFRQFCKKFREQMGWELFRKLAEADIHYFTSIRIPATNEQKEFDELVLGLAKLLVDSLNEERLLNYIPKPQHSILRGSISRLNRAFEALNAKGFEIHIQFLRNLQDLRSSGSAHRKGNNYDRAAVTFGIGSTPFPKVFREILCKALELVRYLNDLRKAGSFDSKD